MTGGQRVAVAHLDVVCALLDDWARARSSVGSDGRRRFDAMGQSTWGALDRLVPLQDPNRWDSLRKAAIQWLEATGGWERCAPPRGSAWWLR